MTATDLLLTDDDELAIVNGDWAFATDQTAILQSIKIRLRFFQGEWVFDLDIGIAYWQSVFIKNPSLIVVREIFRRALLGSPGVVEVVNLNVAYTRRTPRTVAVTWTVRGDVGQLIRGGIGQLIRGGIERSA